MTRPIVHPRRMNAMRNLFPQTVSGYGTGASGSRNAMGERNRQSITVAISALANLKCQINVINQQREASGHGEGETALSTHEIVFGAYHENLSTAHEFRDDATNERYQVILVDRDPASSFSVVQAKKVGF